MSSGGGGGAGDAASGGSNNGDGTTANSNRNATVRIQSSTTVIRSDHGGGVSVQSTHSSVEISSAADEAEMLSIQNTLEQVATAQNSPHTTRTRAGFNSIGDALGNLRTRLHHHAHRQRSSGSSTSGSRNNWINRLSARLHVVDAAHSSRMPLHVMESRRSVPALGLDPTGAAAQEEEGKDDPASARSAPPLHASASIFRVDARETAHYEEHRVDESTGRPTLQHRRSSVLFASRIVANRSIMEGTSNVLLATGGDGANTSRRDLLGASALNSAESLRDFEMHLHPSVKRRMLSPISDSSRISETGTASATTEEDFKMDETIDQSVEKKAEDTNNKLYSWGRGEQSLHDDADDRILKEEASAGDVMQVSSRLETKSILAVAAGQHHAACVTSRGTLYVAGKNVHGCVDPNAKEGEVIARPTLLDCISHVRVVQVSCGYDHTAVLSSNGSVLTWGSNVYGQLGHRVNNNQERDADYKGPTNCRPTGMALGKGRKASSVACGTHYTLVLTQHMSLLACGIPAIAGHRDASKWGMAEEIPSLVGLPLAKIAAGDGHAAVVTAHGTAFVWGENRSGCLGRDYPKTLTLPVPIKALSDSFGAGSNSRSMVSDDIAIQHAACGLEHTVLVTKSGELLVCGSNCRGQLGIAASKLQSTSKVVQVQHPTGGKFVSAESGNYHSLVLDSSGDLWATNPSGLQCILKGKSVLVSAAGGDGNCAAIASARGKPETLLLQRQFSCSAFIEYPEDTATMLDAVDDSLVEMEANKPAFGGEVAQNLEELLQHPPVMNLILNPMKLETLFEKILRAGDVAARQMIATSIQRGLKTGLESLRGSRMIYPEAVRCLLSYIKFFDMRRDEDVSFDERGEAIYLFCDTILGIPFEGYRALHDFATNVYPKQLFVKMLVKPLLLTLNACTKSSIDENEVQHFSPSRRAVPVIVAVLSWLYAMGVEEGDLASPADFYSDGVSQIDTESLFEDLYRMKKASPHEKSKNFYLCAHPFLLSPGCKRNLLQMESQIEMFKQMMGDAQFSASTNEVKVDPFFDLEIEREHLVEQTLEKIKEVDPKDLRKRLKVAFKGEEGLDAGGVTKEFFQLLSEELFDVHSGLWSTKYGDLNWFNADNTWDDKGFELIGVLFGLALYNSTLLDVRFPLAVYRKILGLPLGLEDVPDEELRRGLKQLLDYEDEVEDIFCLSFEVTWMEMGEERRLELKTDGANIPVTNENREEYVLRYVSWVLVDSVATQWDAFQAGVMRVMEDSSLDLFLPEELELLVVGTPELDFEALEANTRYEGGFDKDSEVVRNFWKFVKEASPETQVKLLKFATASTKAPIGGLGKMDFLIQRAGPDSPNLPTSHTCFNTLLLPDYGSDYEKLANLLGRAILECEGFGLE